MDMFDEDKTQKAKPGIKNRNFTSSGTNGQSHRQNAARKKRQHLENVVRRAGLYSQFQGEKGWKSGSTDAGTWHSTLKALSQGTT